MPIRTLENKSIFSANRVEFSAIDMLIHLLARGEK